MTTRACRQALIVTGLSIGTPAYIEAGLKSLRWLMALQTAPSGYFRPVGTREFRRDTPKAPRHSTSNRWKPRPRFPPALAAWRADGDVDHGKVDSRPRIRVGFSATMTFRLPLVDVETGSCRDGLHPDRANENRGGESVVSYLLSLAEIRHLAHLNGDSRGNAARVDCHDAHRSANRPATDSEAPVSPTFHS